ncbi:MAG: hypothetical protein E7Z67_00495 [Thermoplasmata archaeon]|nr:hypothetical protein [Thermoplasmata archaeon]
MHKGRGAFALAVALLMFLSAFPFMSVESDAVPEGDVCDGLLIYEVAYRLDTVDDGFSIKNYSASSKSLTGWYVKDEAGYKVELPDVTLASGEVLTLVKKVVSSNWFCKDRVVWAMTNPGKFSLNNGGDNLYLYSASDSIVDVVSYGSITAPSSGWVGMSADGSNLNEAIKRVEPNDTNTYFDWVAIGDGYTSNGFEDVPIFTGTVEPFVFPDSNGYPIMDAVSSANERVYVSIYMLTSDYMISLLANMPDSVEIKVLLENKPLGYDHPWEKLDVLNDENNVDVKFIGFDKDYDRYSYVHNKYAIIDDDTVIVMSENWTHDNLSASGNDGNRGWGAVVTSTDYADYMESYFLNDWNGKDVGDLDSARAASDKPNYDKTWTKKSKSQVDAHMDDMVYSSVSFDDVQFRMFMAPDNTYKALQYYMDKAEDRIYTEQMDIGKSFEDWNSPSPLNSMKLAADRGVDARFLLMDREASHVVDGLNKATNIKAGMMSGKGYATMHNKGVIIDDCVWVSSVNWTSNAFMNNRECGLFIMDPDVTEFYLLEYMEDWNNDYKGGYTLTVKPEHGVDSVTLKVRDVAGECEWTIVTDAGEEKKTTAVPELVLESIEGLHYVLVESENGKVGRYVYSAPVEDDPEFPVETVATVSAGAVILGLILYILRKVHKRGQKELKKAMKRKSKRK